MIIAVQGTKSFSDYETFMRAMSVALSQLNDDSNIEVWSAGPHNINNYTAAFCNSSENYLKQKGYRISFRKLPSSYIESNIDNISYFAFLSKKNEKVSSLTISAELKDIEVGIFRS